MSHVWKMTLLIGVTTLVYLVGNDRIPLWDRDEPRNAQAARQMLISGDWVVPHFLDQIRTAKPPFTAWCQMGCMAVLGQNSFAARLPSAIAMGLTLSVLAMVLSKFADRERAFWTVFILATSGIVIAWTARNALTDSVLLLWITIAQMGLFAILTGRGSWPVVIATAVAVGLAGLTKGPVVLGGMSTTLIVFWGLKYFCGTGASPVQRLKDDHGRGARAAVKAIVAIAIVIIIVGPWCYLVEHRAPGFLIASTSHDVARRIFEPLEQHKGPPGYYALVVWGIFFPWSVLLPFAIVNAWRHLREDASVRFALAAVIGPWLMVECVATKLPHYLLPVFPALAYLLADGIVRCLRGEQNDLNTRGTRMALGAWCAIVLAIVVGMLIGIDQLDRHLPAALPNVACSFLLVTTGIAFALVVGFLYLKRSPSAGLLAMGVGMMTLMAVSFGVVLPAVSVLQLSPRVADVLARDGADASHTKPGDVQMIQYKEPSLAFYQGGTIREQPKNDFLATHPSSEWPTWTVIRADVWEQMPREVKDQVRVLGGVRGLDIADRGTMYTVMVVRKLGAEGRSHGPRSATRPGSSQPDGAAE